MQSQAAWPTWAGSLRRLGLDGLVAWLLEAGSPLTLLGAHAVYLARPFIGGSQLNMLAQMLEVEDETRAFVQYLRGDASR